MSGGGKSGGGSRQAVYSPITLQANNVARILEVVSEGQIKGLVNGLQSVYFNDTPLQNKNGTFNFEGWSIEARLGTSDQTEIQGFGGVETVEQVGVKVEQAIPVIRRIINPDADYVRIKVAVPALQVQDLNTGDLLPAEVAFRIEVDENETGYQQYGRVWQRINQTGGQWLTSATARGFRIVLRRQVNNPSQAYFLDNVETPTLQYQLLPSGSVVNETYSVTPSAYTVFNATQGYNGTQNFIFQNYKMEENGVSTRDQYGLIYTLDDEIIGLTQGQYRITPPAGWSVVEMFELINKNTVIAGRTASIYEREYLVILPKATNTGIWDLKVTRVSPDSTASNVQNDLYWTSYAVGVETKLTYANRAVVGLKIDASLFGNNLPKRAYLIDGVEVKIPTTYDPITRLYDEPLGYWDGTFQTAWTNNPVWVLYDILTSQRYGGGSFISPSQVDKYSFYECAKYCDELVPVAGRKALEPRFTFNYWFANNESFFDTLNKVASSFNGAVYSVNDVVFLTMDKPKDVVAIFSQANVLNDNGVTFQYSTASVDTTTSVAQVRWNDPDKLYEQSVVTVEDPDLIALYGYQVASISAFGCTSEGQARRQGAWLLDTQKNQYQTVSFVAGLDSADIMIGDVIGIYDPSYQTLRQSGRLKTFYKDIGGTGFEGMRLDSSVFFSSLESYTAYVMMRNGEMRSRVVKPCNSSGVITYGNVEYVRFDTPLTVTVGDETDLTFKLVDENNDFLVDENGDFLCSSDNAPLEGTMWGINASNLAPREFYVVSTSERTGEERFQYEISAVEYDGTKYARIERGIISAKTPQTLVGQDVVLHSNLRGTGYFDNINGVRAKHLFISWTASPDRRITKYGVYYKKPSEEAYTFAGETASSVFDLVIIDNVLDIRVDAIQGTASENRVMGSVSAQLDFAENNQVPANVQNFKYTLQGSDLVFTWDAVLDNDLEGYEIRFTPSKTSTAWDTTPVLIFTTETSLTIPYQDGTYYIKARDFYGLYSENEASRITFNRPDININVVEVLTESPSFDGVKTGCSVTSAGLAITTPLLTDTAYYEFDTAIDLGDVYISRLTSVLKFIMGDTASWVAFMPDVSLEPTMATIDGDTVETIPNFESVEDLSLIGVIEYQQGMLELQVSTSLDNVAFDVWQPFVAGDYEARAFKFRLVLHSFLQSKIPTVTELSVTCDMPDRLESANAVNLPAGTNTITFNVPFKARPNIQVTPLNFEANEYLEITSVTNESFDVYVHHGGGNHTHLVDWLARGYGKAL
jgi:predicted phage tail protein